MKLTFRFSIFVFNENEKKIIKTYFVDVKVGNVYMRRKTATLSDKKSSRVGSQ